MGLVLKLGNLLAKKPLEVVNNFLGGKKTYIAGGVLILSALACLVQEIINLTPLDLNDLSLLLRSDCIRQLGEGLAVVGFRAAMARK